MPGPHAGVRGDASGVGALGVVVRRTAQGRAVGVERAGDLSHLEERSEVGLKAVERYWSLRWAEVIFLRPGES